MTVSSIRLRVLMNDFKRTVSLTTNSVLSLLMKNEVEKMFGVTLSPKISMDSRCVFFLLAPVVATTVGDRHKHVIVLDRLLLRVVSRDFTICPPTLTYRTGYRCIWWRRATRNGTRTRTVFYLRTEESLHLEVYK